MRLLLFLFTAGAVFAQQGATPAAPQAPAGETKAAAPAEQKSEAKPAAPEAQPAAEDSSAASADDRNFSGSVDFGYRWVSGPAGNFNAYRTIVNLGQGPKLFGLDFTIQDPRRRLFDRLDIRAHNFGDDPYQSARIDARKQRVYNLSFDYRNLALFNFLPSYANPAAEALQGGQTPNTIFLNQRAFDTRRKLIDTEIEFRPGSRFIPYFAYTHNSGYGTGITDFVADGNEYPVRLRLDDKTDHFRGGARLEFNKFHVTLEQGGSRFSDDQALTNSQKTLGNRPTTIFGQQLYLTDLNQSYAVSGDSIYSKVQVTANPFTRLDLYGSFLFSQPTTNTDYLQTNTGNFVLLSAVRFFSGQSDLAFAEAKQPHTSGSFGAEFRPTRRLRITELLLTDRLHTSASALLTEQLLIGGTQGDLTKAFTATGLAMNYNQQEFNVLFDLTSRITLRGGHRFVWGDAKVRAPELASTAAGTTGFEPGELRRQVGLAGVQVRPLAKLRVNLDYEGASGDRTYFRTSLQNYHRARARARYQITDSLQFGAVLTALDNKNPAPTVDYKFLSRDSSFQLIWAPKGGKRFSLSGDYTRSTVRSDIDYPLPSALDVRERSSYRDNAHLASALLDIGFPAVGGRSPRLTVGGTYFASAGSGPTRYYQPLGRFSVPLGRRVQWNSEWRWYGFSEPLFFYEGFRTHHFATGLRLGL